jgi:ribonuclease BN (tRNA processing enzyme)
MMPYGEKMKNAGKARQGGVGGKMKAIKRKIRIFFLGTNGWFATKTGNTVCTAIRAKDRLIVLDAGDGFQHLPALLERLGLKRADVFLSHLHLDHISGLHILPRMKRGIRVRIFAHKSYLPALTRFLAHPYTASPSEQFASISLHPFSTGANKAPCRFLSLPLRHADPCFGFCFQMDGKKIAYCTDTGPCRNYTRLASSADLLISECSLLPGTLPMPSWPHLSPQSAAQEAKKANARCLILTHFDASKYRTHAMRKAAQSAARKIFRSAFGAHDGMEIEI